MLIATRNFDYTDPDTGEVTNYKGPRLVDDVWIEADQITDPVSITNILADDVLRTYVCCPQ